MRCNRRIYRRTRTAVCFSFIRWNLGRESNPWFTIRARVYQFRNDPIIRSPALRAVVASSWTVANDTTSASKENVVLSRTFSPRVLFPTWCGGGGGSFCLYADSRGISRDKRLRKSRRLRRRRLYSQTCGTSSAPWQDFVSIMQIRSFP